MHTEKPGDQKEIEMGGYFYYFRGQRIVIYNSWDQHLHLSNLQ